MLDLEEYKLAKLKQDKLYLLPSGALCKINRIDWVHGKVMLYRYDLHENDALDIEIAPRLLTPAMKIGEVAAALQRAPDTLRRYERSGLIASPKRFQLGNQNIRIYTIKDLNDLIVFFDHRNPVGRPSKTNKSFGVNKVEVRRKLKLRFDEIKSKTGDTK